MYKSNYAQDPCNKTYKMLKKDIKRDINKCRYIKFFMNWKIHSKDIKSQMNLI